MISLHSGSLPVHWLRHHYHDWDDYDIHISVKNVLMDLISLMIKMIFPPILSTCPCVFSYDHVSVPELVINDQVMVVLRAIVKIMMILSLCFLNDCIEQPFSSSSSSHSLLAFIADHGLVCGGRVKSLPIDGVVWYVALSRKSSSPSSS